MGRQEETLSHREFAKVTLPFMFSTMTQPLLSTISTALVGEFQEMRYIAGISIGMTIMNTICWLFGFFRVNTTGKSAQAFGNGQRNDRLAALLEPFGLAFLIGAFFILLQKPVFWLASFLFQAEVGVLQMAASYFKWSVWSIPLILVNYVILGWLMGQKQIRSAVTIQIGSNLLNLVFVFVFMRSTHLGLAGIALAGILAQMLAFISGLYFVKSYLAPSFTEIRQGFRWSKETLDLSGNFDMMLRTICLLIQINFFMAQSGLFSIAILSANSILYQLQNLMSYLFDGISNGASFFAGKSRGMGDQQLMQRTWRITLVWSVYGVAALTLIFAVSRTKLIQLFTSLPEVVASYQTYSPWLLIFPCISCLGFTIYGIFTGSGHTQAIRNSTIMALGVFFLVWFVTRKFGNHGLWLAVLGYYGGKSLFLLPYRREIFKM